MLSWRTIGPAAISACALALIAVPAGAEQAVAVLDGTNVLVTLNTSSPGAYTSVKAVTGLQPSERIAAIDFRHLPSQTAPIPPSRLFALGVIAGATDTVRLYTIDAGSGAATPVSALPISVTTGAAYGMDFNPTVDRIRIVNTGDENLRINPNNGTRADFPTNDTDLNLAGNQIAAVAYDRVNIPQPPAVAGNTTLYAVAVTGSQLATIGGLNQAPSPNGGTVNNVGPLGFTIQPGTASSVNLDIAFGGTAFLTAVPSATARPSLYTVNLATGAATLVGTLPDRLGAFATVPDTTVQLAASTVAATESGSATVTVTRSGSLAQTTTVGYTTSDGTAGAGDYAPVTGTLTFARDEATKTLTVPIVQDAIDEPAEAFAVNLTSAGAPATLGSPTTATVTIADDDDTAAPTLRLSGVRSSMRLKAFLKGVTVTVTPSEPVSVVGELQSTVKRAVAAAYNLGIGTKRLALGAGMRSLTIKPKRSLVGHPRKTFKVRLRVTATDAAGNAKVTTKTISVKPR
jgi:hypothetical protein